MTRIALTILPTLVVLGCGATPEPPQEGVIHAGIVRAGHVPVTLPRIWDGHTYTAHEWGTFTSMQSSDGRTLDGLHHEEEPLPPFVHGRDFSGQGKATEWLPEAVTQKMETPVIYFYSDEPRRVRARVDFPDGIISEYYPAPTSFEPGIHEVDSIGGGQMTWDVELHPNRLADWPEVDPADIWAPSRRTASTPLSAGVEEEGFIFYRGVGRFDTPLRVFATDTHLTIRNASDELVPAAFVLNVTAEGGDVVNAGPVPPRASIVVRIPTSVREDYVDVAADAVADAVHDSGLFRDEARAMVDTWRHSYFHSRGTRVLYVLPDAWTDALLPLEITPRPEAIERVLVGRVEALTPGEEQRVLDTLIRHHRNPGVAPSAYLPPSLAVDRFAEPRIRRALELVGDSNPELQSFIRIALQNVSPL